jgi:hypothetical protein
MASDGDSTIPTWIIRYGDVFQEFGRNPSGFIIGVVATWIVGGILLVGRQVVEAVLLAFDSVVNSLDLAREAVIDALDAVAAPVLAAAAAVPGFYAGLVEPLGPLAPVVTALLLASSAYLVYRLLIVAVKEMPVVGGILEVFGVDV